MLIRLTGIKGWDTRVVYRYSISISVLDINYNKIGIP